MTPEMALAAAALRVEKRCAGLYGEDAWLYLAKWAFSWLRDGRHGARSRAREADLSTESALPSAAQQEAVTRLFLDDIRDFVQGPPVPAPTGARSSSVRGSITTWKRFRHPRT